MQKGKIYSLIKEFNHLHTNSAKRSERKHYDSGKNISLSYNSAFYPDQSAVRIEAKNFSKQSSSDPYPESLNNRQDFMVESFEDERITPERELVGDEEGGPPAPPAKDTAAGNMRNRIANLENSVRNTSDTPDLPDTYDEASTFEEDLKHILSGAKVFDANDKTVKVSGAQVKQQAESAKEEAPKPKKNPHAIFDDITNNLSYANAFDLGTINIDKGFDELDKTLSNAYSRQIPLDHFTSAPLNDMDYAEDFEIINEISTREYRSPASVTLSISKQQEMAEPACWQEGTRGEQVPVDRNMSFGLTTPPELTELLSYLHIDYSEFQPLESRYFNQLAVLLTYNNIITANTTIDRTNFRDAVRRFQQSKTLGDDGIPGEDTLWELQFNWANGRNLSIVRVDADQVPGSSGYNSFRLRSDVVPFYQNLRTQVRANHGIVTSAGSFRDLSAQVTAGRSTTSMHYTGIAFDLATDTGMINTSDNPYLITSENGRWHVWNKPSNGGVSRTLDAVVYSNHTTNTLQVTANTIDFSDMARRNGFRDITPRSCFPQDYLCAEWWHFQCEQVLTPFISQFGIELLSLSQYDQNNLSPHAGIWQNRKNIFKKNWF